MNNMIFCWALVEAVQVGESKEKVKSTFSHAYAIMMNIYIGIYQRMTPNSN